MMNPESWSKLLLNEKRLLELRRATRDLEYQRIALEVEIKHLENELENLLKRLTETSR